SREHNLPHEIMDAAECVRRFPPFRIPSDYVAVFQPGGGFLAAEASVEAMIDLARAERADIRTGVRVLSVTPHGPGVRVATSGGGIEARAAIVAAGAWLKDVLPDLPAPVRATREVMAWFKPADATPFDPRRFPVFILESRHGMHYGFPATPAGLVKIAKHHHRNETVLADELRRAVSDGDEALIRPAVAGYIPAADRPPVAAQTRLHPTTPAHRLIITP